MYGGSRLAADRATVTRFSSRINAPLTRAFFTIDPLQKDLSIVFQAH